MNERRLCSDEKLERIYRAAIRVLCAMGMKVENRQCLEAMERFGCKIDYPNERAVFSPETIDRVLEIVRDDTAGWERGFNPLPVDQGIGGGGTCPFYFDETVGERQRATEADCIEALKVVETSPVVSSGPPVSNGDCSPKYEAIRCIELGIETFNKTICGGTDLFFVEQLPFAVELGLLYRNDPKWFISVGNCPNSPLCVGKTIADLAIAKVPYKVPYAVPTMPVMGANAPITPAGTAVIGLAEILGGYVLAKSLDVETPVFSAALSSLMDMKSGSMVYVAPEVFAADVAICEVMELWLGLPCSAFGIYIDAKLPGFNALRERLLRSLGLGIYANLSGFEGTLDQGRVFSPTQLMLDCDLHRCVASYTGGWAVDEETLAVDAILDIAWDGSGYLTHDHTMSHMRDIWSSSIYRNSAFISVEEGAARERECLDRARQMWRDNLSDYEPPNHSDGFLRELKAISTRAREALA